MKTNQFSFWLWKLFRHDSLLCRAVAAMVVFRFSYNGLANPTGMTVQSGAATLHISGSQLTITTGNNASLNWQTFNIATGEKTVFNQPSASSVVWNHISDPNPSQIYGSLQANGIVVLLNSSGFYFGPNSFVSAAGLVVSTANCQPPQNSGGGWEFNGPPPLASIVNYGTIQVGQNGSAFLIADKVENHGTITAPGGSIALAAGQTVMLSERPDGRGMSMNVVLPQGSVDNYGNLIADGGTIALNAKVVNQNGFIQANSVRNVGGVIELVASDSLNLGGNSQILAQGDSSTGGSAGGSVTLKSENNFSDSAGSQIDVSGGANGGNGGTVEISAPAMSAIHSTIDGHAQAGSTGGQLLLDPDYIVLDQSGSDTPTVNGSSGTVLAGDSPGDTLYLNVGGGSSTFSGLSEITLQAKYDISLADGTAWNLSGSTGLSSGHLTLEAGGNIIFGNATSIFDANSWSINLLAGVNDFKKQTITPGAGSILIDSNDPFNPSFIQTAAGTINLVAGADITLGTAYINTTGGGGGISAHALTGNIDTGSVNQGYFLQSADTASDGCTVGAMAGGISTLAGGDVHLTAGGNVTSVLPTQNGYYFDGTLISTPGSVDGSAGSGAYGNQPGQAGNVTIVAGGNVTGNYVVANGVGKIFAGATMDAEGNPVTDLSGNYVLGNSGSAGTDAQKNGLSLNLLGQINGGWNVSAAQNIFLQEVRNPNGIFNVNPGGADHLFDYAAGDYVNLSAGNLVQLGSTVVPRDTSDGLNPPYIYPGILNISAGAGGVVLSGNSAYNQLILYPSPQGSLSINTTQGGSLVGSLPAINGVPQIFNLIVSDSGRSQYTASGNFGLNDHAATPIHHNQATPIALNISGDMDYLLLGAPEAATLNVVGNINNSRFQGMNLSDSDVTSITVGQAAKVSMENSGLLNPATDGGLTVGGDIDNRSAFTSIDLTQVSGAAAPDLSVLPYALSGSISPTTLINSLYYNPATGLLTYQNIPNVNIAAVLQLLQNLTVQKTDSQGNLLWLDPLDTIPATETVSVLNSATASALLAEYNSLGAVPSGSFGYSIGGGGKFEITARNVDLGTTAGIKSWGVGLYKVGGNYPLASYFDTGADIIMNLTGDLSLYSSSIASLNGGNISIYAGGDVNVGSSDFSVTALGARGIFTTSQSDVTVVANGNVNVNGSRIAAYDGGNVTVESINGDVNAGTGGSGFVVVSSYKVNPATHQVSSETPTIPGSGILATTFPDDAGQVVGNILVETPNGNVNANAGGIVELPLNGVNTANSVVEVLAGSELRDANGNRLLANSLDETSIQGSVGPATAGDPARTVVIGTQHYQVAASIWPDLLSLLGLAPDSSQNVVLNGSSVPAGFLNALQTGNSAGLSGYSYVTAVGANKNIDASGSGVIGSTVKLNASGGIVGVIFARNNIDLNAQQNVSVTALAQGNVNVSANGTISGTLIGVGGVSASGGAIDAQVLSQNSNVNGQSSGDTFAAGTAANAASAGASNQNVNQTTTKSDSTDDEPNKKKGKGIALAQKVSRVTVLLPQKN